MNNPTINDLLTFANLQMAAETFLANKAGQLETNPKQVLIEGNFHASRFTPTQADAFLKEWEVVAQKPTTSTGFSGTLFKNRKTDELVISLRSTEFIDDAARDNEATNSLEIFETGYAWGQLRDMARWYQELQQRGDLPANANLTVTGYSLGGHLATALNLVVVDRPCLH